MVFSKTKKSSGELNNMIKLPLKQIVQVYNSDGTIQNINIKNYSAQVSDCGCNKK